MPTDINTLLCHYQYDPLNRLVDSTYSGEEGARRFYQKDRLATEIHGALKRSIMQHEDQLLAQQQRKTDAVETSLIATDQQRTVLNVLDAPGPQPIAHTPYGHRPSASGLLSLLGFNGERPDPVTGHYLLGNGYRAFNPVLMRFNSPDSWSPFGKGGLNAYAYCVGDPVNRRDPTGHTWVANFFGSIRNLIICTRPRYSPRPSASVETTSSHLADQSSPAANLNNVDPPPPNSPRNRRAAMELATDTGPAPINRDELLVEINSLVEDIQLQAWLLDRATEGSIRTTPFEFEHRVSRWQEMRSRVVALNQLLPPPSYRSVTDPHALPDYLSAVRNS